MTESGYWGFIRAGLRAKFTRYPVKYKVKNAARRDKPKNKKGRHKYEYQCAYCKKYYMDKEVQVDHIVPCGSLRTPEDLVSFVPALFCEEEDLQVLCKPCHQKKTNKERGL